MTSKSLGKRSSIVDTIKKKKKNLFTGRGKERERDLGSFYMFQCRQPCTFATFLEMDRLGPTSFYSPTLSPDFFFSFFFWLLASPPVGLPHHSVTHRTGRFVIFIFFTETNKTFTEHLENALRKLKFFLLRSFFFGRSSCVKCYPLKVSDSPSAHTIGAGRRQSRDSYPPGGFSRKTLPFAAGRFSDHETRLHTSSSLTAAVMYSIYSTYV